MKNIPFLLFAFFVSCSLFSQTQSVQSFTYNSTTRDTVIRFPEGDHNSYERILMHYSMRCKDALVSTGSNRNLGCGEWDYSCNTYIVDSTRVDSVKATSPEYAMPGFNGDVFSYTDRPVYEFYQSVHKLVSIDAQFGEDLYPIFEESDLQDTISYSEGPGAKVYFLVEASWLEERDLDNINAMKLPLRGNATLVNLEISIAQTEASSVREALLDDMLVKETYFNADFQLGDENNHATFFEKFKWDDTSNLLISLNFDRAINAPLEWIELDNPETDFLIYQLDNSKYMRCGSSGRIILEEGIPELDDAVTIAFWQRGSETLPVNSTIIEAVDKQGQRQMNIHLPWGNSQVYWDCGNDGGGYDRINKPANPGDFKSDWNHWAFTKDAQSGRMEIYLNGNIWHSGTEKNKTIDAQYLSIGANSTASLYYYGDMEELAIFDKALGESEIRQLMYGSPAQISIPDTELLLHFDFNNSELSQAPEDLSGFARPANMEGVLAFPEWHASDIFTDETSALSLPAFGLIDGNYLIDVKDSIVLDSVPLLPQRINHYGLDGTDLELIWTDFYYPSGDSPVYNEEGDVVAMVNYPESGSFEKGELIYFSKSPMAYEIMSFVTPYGIGLDFGEEGLTWTFDVTDFGPLLKGDKRIFMSRGGQWQEDMDIRFEFIEGIPDRDVIDIQQIWRVDQVPYGNILNDWRFEPRQFTNDPAVDEYIIRTAITGHGQEGEFIQRNHSINVGGFPDTWTVWKECAENPVYPQGGTWVYDRAGWCPGMATDVRNYNVTEFFQFLQDVEVDYTIQGASGDSRYIVNSQLLKYGPPNKSYDVSIIDLVHPSPKIEHGRFNPSCHAPELVIKNRGAETLSSVTIKYGIRGKSEKSYQWQGTLPFLIEKKLTLPYDPALASAENGDTYFVEVETPGLTDENPDNNSMETKINLVDHYDGSFILEWRTNFTPQETSYVLEDENGNTIAQKFGSSIGSNRISRDTFSNLNGCYRLFINDTDDDGISWWANNDGNGYIRVKEDGGNWKNIATDFGAFIEYNFTAGMISSVSGLMLDEMITAYPNPSTADVFISGLDEWDNQLNLKVTNQLGQVISQTKLDKAKLVNGYSGINALHEGIYYLEIRDTQRIGKIKLIRI